MAVSSLGLGSGVLTQDVLDQLRKADESSRVTPIDMQLALVKDEQGAFNVLDAKMTNLIDSIDALKRPLLYDERTARVTGTSVAVTASANSDLQEFTLNVTQLATKQIEESGSFGSETDTIASAAGSINLNIDGTDFTIDYDDTTTLKSFKKSINDIAGDKVNATIVQIASGDYRLFLNSVGTGSNQDITITDNSGNLSGTQLTDDLTALQTGVDATFEFNGQTVTRSSNEVTDLVTGYDITLKELGSSSVKIEQNRDAILEKIDSFVEKYNDAMGELGRLTVNSTNSDERGIFAGNSTIRSMQLKIRNLMDDIGGGVGNIYDYGFDIDKSGKLTFDKSVFNDALDADAANVEAFFSGGDFDNGDGTTTIVDGIFNELSTAVGAYTNYDQTLDQFKKSLMEQSTELEDRRATEIERLDNKYATLQKQWAAYDALIAKLTSSANAFIQMVNTQNSTKNN
ncbi:flagellar filament capping protein FliD [Sulfurimonas paralvinellae]|uniref:Flagellar hook-associated protein 2 n=1 Tax=Sulfurimonas paralvinellae TaxID=317658 RepID=A0A7M1B7Y6_9BACT|nr:flagellar filament capping protein FliD [Sulfurimonas paralvinellae]QOP44888.1 flagellar hook protein [Sulfurimonas paralvinellae]